MIRFIVAAEMASGGGGVYCWSLFTVQLELAKGTGGKGGRQAQNKDMVHALA